MTTSLLSPRWKVNEMWGWGWCSLRLYPEGEGANGGGVPADTDTSAPMIFVSSHRMPRKDPRGQVIFVGGHICVCVHPCSAVMDFIFRLISQIGTDTWGVKWIAPRT